MQIFYRGGCEHGVFKKKKMGGAAAKQPQGLMIHTCSM